MLALPSAAEAMSWARKREQRGSAHVIVLRDV
jgi:hypothetical protein